MNQYKVMFLLTFLVLLTSCALLSPSDAPQSTLSNMQITACNAANQAGTCNSRLPEVGIVLQEECCEQLGKCCS